MNEEALKHAYDLFVKDGYNGSIDDYKSLISSNNEALSHSYGLFKNDGYADEIDDFKGLVGVGTATQPIPPVEVKKKGQSATTELPVAASSSALPSQKQPEEEGFLSKAKKALQKGAEWNYASLAGVGEKLLTFYDDAINATKAALGGAEEKPLTPQQQKEKAFKEKFGIQDVKSSAPLDPRTILTDAGNIANQVINAAIPQEQKNKIIQKLSMASNTAKVDIERLKDYKEKHLPDNLLVQTAQGILEMAPDLALAAVMENPQIAESKFAQTSEKIASKLSPYFKKNVPKAAKVLEESIRAPFTKIIAVKEAVKEMGETKQGESSLVNGLEGAAKGALEGMEMHGLGVAAGKVATPVSRAISRLGINSAIASSIATPLANAGVFTTARAIRKGITEGEMITPEEIAQEAAMGVGFSLLHLGSQYKNQNEANHYYDNVLNDDELHSFGRVINETKDNLDLAYNPDLTPEKVQELKDARDEIKKAILREPEMQKKKELGDQAVKIQNQIDAYNNINKIVEDKDILVEYFKQNNQLNPKQKERIINKIKAIAETYDMSEYAVKTREFNTKITEAQKELDAAGERFTNAKNPVARAEAKNEVDLKRKELEELNNQLTELITKKQEQDAIQKQESDESMLRAGEERLGLRQVGKGNAESQITPEQEQAIAAEDAVHQEKLDNPYDEQDIEDAKSYFENPIAYLEDKVKFWEDEVDADPNDETSVSILNKAKAALEAHKAAEAKPEVKETELKEGSKVKWDGEDRVVKSIEGDVVTMEDGSKHALDDIKQAFDYQNKAQPEGITIGAGSATATTGKPTEVTTEGKATETKTAGTEMSENDRRQMEERELDKLNDDVYDAQRNMARSDNPEEAIKTFQEIKKKRDDFEAAMNKRQEDIKYEYDLDGIIYDENEKQKEEGEDYEYADLYKKDPRLAALQRNKDMLDFINSQEWVDINKKRGESDEAIKERREYNNNEIYGKDIKILERSLKENPPKEKSAKEKKSKEKTEPTIITVKAGEGVRVSEGEPTAVTTAKTAETKTEGVDIKSLPKYEETMAEVEFLVPKSKEYVDKDLKKAKERYRLNKTEANKAKLDKAKADYEEYKADVASAKEKAMNGLTDSETYKAADQVQQDALVRELAKKFGEKQPIAPKPEELFGNVAEAAEIMKELNELFDDANKSKDYLDQKYKEAKAALDKNPTSEKLKRNLDKIKAEIEEYKTKNIDEAIKKLKESESYKNAKPEQQAKMEKYLTDKFLKSQTSKILPTKLFGGAKDIKKVTITEKKRWVDQLKAFVRGAKNAAEATKTMMSEIKSAISELSKGGNITAKQAETIINKMASLKVSNEKGITKFIDYVSKVFADAEYGSKIAKANDTRRQISKLSGVKGKDANLVGLAKEFRKIKPSMVEDIDAYNEMAEKIKESLRGTKIGNKEEPLQVAEMVKISEADKYIKEQLDAQNEKLREEKLAEMNELYDTDFEGATLEQLLELAKSGKPVDKEKETIIRDAIKKMFDMNSTVIKHIIETGKDPFTGEDVELSEEDKKTIKRFMSIDTNKLSMKEAADAIDSLSNFLQNGSTANMETEVRNYQGKLNVEELIKKKLVAKNLTFYGSEHFGRVYADQVATLPMVFELMFKGVGRSSEFEKMSGITELKNAKTFVQYTSTKMGDEYTKEFYERKANDKDFTDASNVAERGMVADLKRTIPGTPEEQQKEFERNKKLIEQSIEELKVGNEKERELGKIYEEVYDKIAKDSKDINEVISKSDKNNVEAVDWWTNKWSEIYDQLAEVSEKVYNKKLDRDLFFTPKRLSKLFGKEDPMTSEEQEELDKGSMFHNNAGSVYKKETGVLKKVNKDYTKLPKNENGEAKRFVDLSFDRNNANSMYDALMDIHTAGVIRQVESFFKSPELKKVIPSAEDRDILYNSRNNGRVQDFIRAVRNKEIVNSSETEKLLRKLNLWSSLGVSGGLGSVSNLVKQTIPVGMNTIINAGRLPDLTYMFGDKADFMDRIGYGVSIRGLESQAQISSINKLVDIASKSVGRDALDAVEKLNRFWLDTFLKNPDVFIAKASWIAYYEKYLKSKGTDPSTIDYKTVEVDEDAANYAQKMVDRQQNISDTDLQGKLLGSKSSSQRFLTSTLMPFASFRLNQFVRAKSDLATIMSKDPAVTAEDRKTAVKSMAGYATEMFVFKLISTKISELIGTAANAILGRKESDEDKKKRIDNLKRGQVTGAITDIFSPIPTQVVDLAYAKGANFVLDMAQSAIGKKDEDKYKLMINSKVSDVQSLGTLGIAIGKLQILKEAMQLSKTGEFVDDYGRKKYLSKKDQDAMKSIATISFLNNVGLLPAEANSISRNAIKYAKKDASSKEGGKSEEDTQMDEQMQEKRTLNKEEIKQEREMKASVLDELKQNEYEDSKIEIIDRKIKEYLMTDEERKKYNEDKKAERFKEKQKLEQLLGKYESKSDMKRYDPALYEETFGEGSQWYQDHKDEIEVEKMMNEAIKKKKDEAEGYIESDNKSGFGSAKFGRSKFGTGKFGSSKFGSSKFGKQ